MREMLSGASRIRFFTGRGNGVACRIPPARFI